jgi:hypothetical protein
MPARGADDLRRLIDRAGDVYRGSEAESLLRSIAARLDEPLRVAIAGKVKAGKSTLLNALVGEQLAPTGVGETTRIVTWYTHGPTYRVTLHGRDGRARQVPFRRDDGVLDIDLQGTAPDDVERLVVEWPTRALESMTLIDTPGLASLSTEVAQRTEDLLLPEGDRPSPVDAVVYLLRHLHATDLRVLDAFAGTEEAAGIGAVYAVGVLSRADEVGPGRTDAMASAARVAERYRHDDRLRRLVQTVVPVCGLLAETGCTLREREFAALKAFAELPRDLFDPLVVSCDRFVASTSVPHVEPAARAALLDRFGMFGIRFATTLLRTRAVSSAPDLASELVRVSGVRPLQHELQSRLTARADALKARSALRSLEAIIERFEVPEASELAGEIERITAGAHGVAELGLLAQLRSGALDVRPEEAETIERLIGSEGDGVTARLGLPDDASTTDTRRVLVAELTRWQERAEDPLASRAVVDASRAVVRVCERLLALTSS